MATVATDEASPGKPKKPTRAERWATFKNTLPKAVELARPQFRLWTVGLVLMLINRLAGLVLPGAPKILLGTGMVELLGGLVTAALAFCILVWINWQMTAAILTFLVLFAFIMVKAFGIMRPIFKERQRLTGDVSGRLTESVGGVRVVKAYNKEDVERDVFTTGVTSLLDNILKTINAISTIALTSSILLGVLGATILVIGGSQLISGEMKAGEFISYILYMGAMIAPISSIVMVGTQLSEVFAGIERMQEVLGETTEDADDAKLAPLGRVEGRVEFRNVDFHYDEGKPVLRDINFTSEPGTITAIVGPSGSGKSTLIGLVAAFFRPVSGSVLVDGNDLATVRLHDFRGQLGCVLQESFLFAGSIRENILYARPNATEEEVLRAARLAYCDAFVKDFEKGYDTIVGERGVKLSGGQRQRVSIARALLADPRILLLDEATSALDSESEAMIQEGLAELMKGRTTFVIAHRLSTIRHASRILVLEEGRIVESGTHRELLAAKGRYFEMYSRQHDVESNLFLAPGENPQPDDTQPEEDGKPRRPRPGGISRVLTGE